MHDLHGILVFFYGLSIIIGLPFSNNSPCISHTYPLTSNINHNLLEKERFNEEETKIHVTSIIYF
jgi:hypothetical protein